MCRIPYRGSISKKWCRLPTGRLSRLGPRALAGPQRVGLGPFREPVGVFPLHLEHAVGVVEKRLARAVEERLLPGRIAEPVLTPSAIADLCRKLRTKKAPIAAP